MAKPQLSVRYIRIATKERPPDRFLTVQVRAAKPDQPVSNDGELYILVEILNPWFPNSHVGQTIINTVVREYHRADNNSPLANFEFALRKTNAVLGEITQHGETDWIGNLSSLIVLSLGEHLYVAQTGRARAYLVRSGKISDLTEGLDEEASQHPLTTYTNITSGTAEAADRLLLASSQLPDVLPLANLKPLLAQPDVSLSGRDLVRALHTNRAKRTNALLLEFGGPAGTNSETLYLDQPLGSLKDSLYRTIQHQLKPLAGRSATFLRQQTQALAGWSRDWLIPRLVTWRHATRSGFERQQRFLNRHAQPLLARSNQQLRQTLERLPKLPSQPAATELAAPPLAGYQIHHYEEQRRITKRAALERSGTVARLRAIGQRLGKLTAAANLSHYLTARTLLLAVALIALLVVGWSTRNRRGGQVAIQHETTATTALAQAQTERLAAERALALNQTNEAAEHFAQAIDTAQLAVADPATQAAATAELTAMQAELDKLDRVTRLAASQPVAIPTTANRLANVNGTTFGADIANAKIYAQPTTDGNAFAQTMTLPILLPTETVTTVSDSQWYFVSPTGAAAANLNDGQTRLIQATEAWQPATALAGFAGNLYLLSPAAQQIWKYAAAGAGFGSRRAYLKETADLSAATDLAIDGDVYILTDTTVLKYSAGIRDASWQLETPPQHPGAPLKLERIFTEASSSSLFGYAPTNDRLPPRIIEYSKAGRYQRQLYLPTDWQLTNLAFNPTTRTGAALGPAGVHLFQWE